MAMYRQGKTHSPIIMQSVKSTQVQKPVLQMAGAVAPGPASPSELVGPGGVLPGGGGAYRGVATPVTVPPPPPSYAVRVVTLLKFPIKTENRIPPFKSSFFAHFHFPFSFSLF